MNKPIKTIDDWLALMPVEWQQDAKRAWEEGFRLFRKVAIRPGELDPVTNEISEGSKVGDVVILEYPELPPQGCIYQLAWSIDGRGWTYHLPGPTVAGDSEAFISMLRKFVGQHDEMREYFMDTGRELIDENLPKWLAYGNDTEQRMARDIHDFLAFASDHIRDSKYLKGVFYAGFHYHQMMIRHHKVEAAQNIQPGHGLRAIIRQALKIHGDMPAEELLRKMGARRESAATTSWKFPDGSVYTQDKFAKALSNERKGN